MAEKLTEAQEAERATWQYRTIAHLRGNQTIAGCILLAALGRVASNPPTFGLHAVIDADGYVFSDFVDRSRQVREAIPICSAEQLAHKFRDVADELKLDDDDRTALFDEIRKWISKDLRAINNMEGDHNG